MIHITLCLYLILDSLYFVHRVQTSFLIFKLKQKVPPRDFLFSVCLDLTRILIDGLLATRVKVVAMRKTDDLSVATSNRWHCSKYTCLLRGTGYTVAIYLLPTVTGVTGGTAQNIPICSVPPAPDTRWQSTKWRYVPVTPCHTVSLLVPI